MKNNRLKMLRDAISIHPSLYVQVTRGNFQYALMTRLNPRVAESGKTYDRTLDVRNEPANWGPINRWDDDLFQNVLTAWTNTAKHYGQQGYEL